MSRQDIADYLGLTIETVSRTFPHLEREAFIEVTTARQITLMDRKGCTISITKLLSPRATL